MIELKIPFLKEEEKEVKIFDTAGESVWGPGLLAQIQARGRELRGKEREPQIRTLELDTDFLAMYPYTVEQTFMKSHEDDVVMAKAMMDKYNGSIDPYEEKEKASAWALLGDTWGDKRSSDFEVRTRNDESDAQDIIDMMSESPFVMGERVLYGTSYATVIGFRPHEVLIDYADLSGDTWVDEDDLEEVFDEDEHNFRDYNDWKLRGIDKTLD